jgi:hypothetical protein
MAFSIDGSLSHVCVMSPTHETFGSADTHGILRGGDGGKPLRKSNVRKSAKCVTRTAPTHPLLRDMGVPMAVCTTRYIRSANASNMRRVCKVGSQVIDDSMSERLSAMVTEESKKSHKGNSKKTRKLNPGVVTESNRRTKKRK